MKLTDRRLYQAATIQDFFFRLHFREEDALRRIATREIDQLITTAFEAPGTEQIWGIDISDWDGNVDLRVTRNSGASFAIIKAMDGTIPSKYWRANHQRAVEAGLPDGPYAWLYPDVYVSCISQARAYWQLVGSSIGRLPPTIDFEWTRYAGATANPNYQDLDKWVTEFNRLSPIKPILYSAAGYMNMFGRMPDSLRKKFSGFWFASYGGSNPIYPLGFGQYDIWQFSATGEALALAPGDRNKRELDLNYMTREFAARFNIGASPLPGPGDPMANYAYSITPLFIDGCSVRPEPDTGNTKLPAGLPHGKFAYGNRRLRIAENKFENGIQVNQANDVWLEVLEVNGTVLAQPAYIAEIHLGKRFATIQQIGTVPPGPEPEPTPTLPEIPVTIVLGDDVTYEKQTIQVMLKPK